MGVRWNDRAKESTDNTEGNMWVRIAEKKGRIETDGIQGSKRTRRNMRLRQLAKAWRQIAIVSVCVLGLTAAGATPAAADQPVEVVSTKKVKSLVWLWTLHSTMGFSPDGSHFLLGEERPDGYVHLCAYETATFTSLKCLVRLHKSRGSHHGPLDWPDDRLFIQAGGFDDAFIGWVSIRDWQKPTFKEIDGLKQMRFIQGKEGMNPAWDKKEGGLYFRGIGTVDAIYFEKSGVRTKFIEDGEDVIPGGKFIWFTGNAEHTFGLRRLDRATKKIEILSKGDSFQVNALTASSQDQVLFVRTERSQNPNPRVYAFIEKQGIWGPVYGPATDGEIQFIRISPNGDRALLSVHDEKQSTPGRNRHHIYLLELLWAQSTAK
jgi:hypothetical protein